MSTLEPSESENNKRRGRPPKNPNCKIQDKKAYMKEYQEKRRQDPSVKAAEIAYTAQKLKQHRKVFNYMKQLCLEDNLDLTLERKKEIMELIFDDSLSE